MKGKYRKSGNKKKLVVFFFSEARNVVKRVDRINTLVNASVSGVVLHGPDLSFAVDLHVAESSLNGLSLPFADIGHLDGLFAEFPFVSFIVRINELLNEMHWSLRFVVNHHL